MESNDISLKVDSLFKLWDKPNSPGVAVLILKDGKIIHKKGYGFANLEHDVPIDPNTIFHVASVSKQFTAFAIALLAHEGKLCLDDEIQKYVPEMAKFEHPITIRHLVHHVSGLRDQWALATIAGWRMDDVITTEHLMKIITNQQELNFAPGSKFLYSNSGYTLMAIIVERITGIPFPKYIKRTVLEPLRMNNSHVHDDHELIVKNRAYSYAPKPGGGFKKKVLSYANFGATSLFTTAEDLSKWMNNYTTAKVGGPQVISQMHERYTLTNGKTIDYAFGLMSKHYKGLPLIYHTGSDAGFRAYFGRFPEHRLGIILLSNVTSFQREQLAMRIADICLKPQIEKYQKSEPIQIDYKSCDGTYLIKSLGKLLSVEHVNNGFAVHLEGWDKQLTFVNETQNTRENDVEKYKFAETDKFIGPENAYISFISPEGKSNQLMPISFQIILNTYGEDLAGAKLDVVDWPIETLSEYIGTYRSAELNTAYHIIMVGDNLVLQHNRHKDSVLISTGKDEFRAKSGALTRLNFIRNERDGKVAGFKNTGDRVFNVLFEKQ